MEQRIFNNCYKCIGITPCTINHKGEIICEFCHTRLNNKKIIYSPSDSGIKIQEKSFF